MLALALMHVPAEKPSGWLTAALSAHVLAQSADATTTAWGRGAGMKEANPAMRWAANDPLTLALVKGGFAVLSTLALLKIAKRHPKAAQIAAWAMAAITGTAAVVNAQRIRRAR